MKYDFLPLSNHSVITCFVYIDRSNIRPFLRAATPSLVKKKSFTIRKKKKRTVFIFLGSFRRACVSGISFLDSQLSHFGSDWSAKLNGKKTLRQADEER